MSIYGDLACLAQADAPKRNYLPVANASYTNGVLIMHAVRTNNLQEFDYYLSSNINKVRVYAIAVSAPGKFENYKLYACAEVEGASYDVNFCPENNGRSYRFVAISIYGTHNDKNQIYGELVDDQSYTVLTPYVPNPYITVVNSLEEAWEDYDNPQIIPAN